MAAAFARIVAYQRALAEHAEAIADGIVSRGLRPGDRLATEADEVVCAFTPRPFHAVGLSYRDFSQTTDTEVSDLLRRAASGAAGPGPPTARS